MRKLILTLIALASLTLANYSAKAHLGFSKAECDALYKSLGIDSSTLDSSHFAPGMAFTYSVDDVMITVILKDDKVVAINYIKINNFSEAAYQAILEKNGVQSAGLRKVEDDAPDCYWKHSFDDLEFADSNGVHILRNTPPTTSKILIFTREGHEFLWSYLKANQAKNL